MSFHYNEMQLLDYIISLQAICIEDKQIETIDDWAEP